MVKACTSLVGLGKLENLGSCMYTGGPRIFHRPNPDADTFYKMCMRESGPLSLVDLGGTPSSPSPRPDFSILTYTFFET